MSTAFLVAAVACEPEAAAAQTNTVVITHCGIFQIIGRKTSFRTLSTAAAGAMKVVVANSTLAVGSIGLLAIWYHCLTINMCVM